MTHLGQHTAAIAGAGFRVDSPTSTRSPRSSTVQKRPWER